MDVAQSQGGPNYSEQPINDDGFYRANTRAEGIGRAGGYFYSLHGEVLQDKNGNWFVYASATARAPAAAKVGDAIRYNSTISVYENGSLLYDGRLRVWDNSQSMLLQQGHTYIGEGYMPLPATGNNISVDINISYNVFNWWNGHAVPVNPYTYTINF